MGIALTNGYSLPDRPEIESVRGIQEEIQEEIDYHLREAARLTEYLDQLTDMPFHRLLAVAATACHTTPAAIISKCRTANPVRARFALAYFLREHGMTLQGIGRRLKRNHSSILHALREVLKRKAAYALVLARLEKEAGTGREMNEAR